MVFILCFGITISLAACGNAAENPSSYASDTLSEDGGSAHADPDSFSSAFVASDNSGVTSGNSSYDPFGGSGVTSREKIMSITPDMTYAQIIERLGTPKTVGIMKGFAQYVVDKKQLLLLFYDDANAVCKLTAEDLLNSCLDFDDFEYDKDSFTTEAVIIRKWGLITCPWYPFFSEANLQTTENTQFISSTGQTISKADLNVGDKIRITHEELVLESYPALVRVTKIIKE